MRTKIIRAVLVLVIALILVVAGSVYANDAQLQASTENVYEDAPAVETPTREVIEIVIDVNDAQENGETEEPPADGNAEAAGTDVTAAG